MVINWKSITISNFGKGITMTTITDKEFYDFSVKQLPKLKSFWLQRLEEFYTGLEKDKIITKDDLKNANDHLDKLFKLGS